MEATRIQVHSITDLITNSSTVIYTYSGASVAACEEMINAILESLGSAKKCSDMFRLSLEPSRDRLGDYVCDHSDELGAPEEVAKELGDWSKCGDVVRKALDDAAAGGAKPEWLATAESRLDDMYDGYETETFLVVTPLSDEFKPAAEAVCKFLYSTNHEATHDG